MKRSISSVREELFLRRDQYFDKRRRLSAIGSAVGYTATVLCFLACIVLLPPLLKQKPLPIGPVDSSTSFVDTTAPDTTVPDTSHTDTIPPSSEETTDDVTETDSVDPPETKEIVDALSLTDHLRLAGCPEERMVTIAREITDEEWAALDAFTQMRDTMRYYLATDFFTPEDVDLHIAFYDYDGPDVSKEEKEAFSAIYPYDVFEITKIPGADLEADVRKNLGISVTQDMIERFVGIQDEHAKYPYVYYLEEYDAYYMSQSDTAFEYHRLCEGYYTTDGRYLLLLYSPEDHGPPILTLYDPVEDYYQLNMAVRLSDDALPDELPPTEDAPIEAENMIEIGRSDGRALTVSDEETVNRLLLTIQNLKGTANGTTKGYEGPNYRLIIKQGDEKTFLNIWGRSSYSIGTSERVNGEIVYPDLLIDSQVADLILRIQQLLPWNLDVAYASATSLHKQNPDLYRDVAELQSETQNVILFDDGQYYQTYTASTHDMVFVFTVVGDAESGGAVWDWVPIGPEATCSISNIGWVDEDPSIEWQLDDVFDGIHYYTGRHRTEYDEDGRIAREVLYRIEYLDSGYSITEPVSEYTYDYNSEGQLVYKYCLDPRSGNVYEYHHYSYGGNTIVFRRYCKDELVGIWVSYYDDHENLTETYRFDNSIVTERQRYRYEYDEEGRVTAKHQLNDEGDTDYCTRYDYDAQGRVVRQLGPEEETVTEFQYDSHGNLIETAIFYPNGEIEKHGSEYTYDSLGRVEKLKNYTVKFEASGTTYEGPQYKPLYYTNEYREDGRTVERSWDTATDALNSLTVTESDGRFVTRYIP